jgi:hypothetical protein
MFTVMVVLAVDYVGGTDLVGNVVNVRGTRCDPLVDVRNVDTAGVDS